MKNFFLIFVCLITVVSCNPDKRPETAVDTGRAFIRASLDGDFKKAGELVLPDTQNIQLFDRYKTFYSNMPATRKEKYRTADYTINKYSDLNDSVTTINYSNSYMNKPMDIRVVRSNRIWSVDFKYAYSGNDTTALKQ